MKFIKIKFFLVGLFILGIVNIPYFCFAEAQIEIQEGDINVDTTPSNPQPYQDVTITLSSFATDLSKAIITWQSGNGIVMSGIGKTKYTFKAGKENSYNIFNISITPVGSVGTITKTITILPSEIDVVWESVDGYVPPFYKGKALPTGGSFIRVVAIPNTDTIKSGNGSLTYSWKNSDSAVPDASGYNKNSYVFKNSLLDDINTISVTASSVNGNYTAENITQIPIYDPKIIFYKKSPTEGVIYSKALDKEATMTEDEMTLVVEPYFISMKGHENSFTYDWQINGKGINTPAKKTELTVRPESRGGYSIIEVIIQNANEVFQKVTGRLKLNL